MNYAAKGLRSLRPTCTSTFADLRLQGRLVTIVDGPPELPTLCREVFRWIQSLDLSYAIKNPRRDCANGFIIAELFSRYFPKDVTMHSFENGKSMHYRNDNWEQLQKVCRRHGFEMPSELVQGTVHEQFGAAVALLELLYEHFTQKTLRRPEEIAVQEGQTTKPAQKQAEATSPGEQCFPGAAGSAAMQKGGKVPEPLGFGQVKQRAVDDGAALRKQFGNS